MCYYYCRTSLAAKDVVHYWPNKEKYGRPLKRGGFEKAMWEIENDPGVGLKGQKVRVHYIQMFIYFPDCSLFLEISVIALVVVSLTESRFGEEGAGDAEEGKECSKGKQG